MDQQDSKICIECGASFFRGNRRPGRFSKLKFCSRPCQFEHRRKVSLESGFTRLAAGLQENPITGCWEWTKSKCSSGYGYLRLGGKEGRAHRAAYEIFVGPIGPLWVLHKCDNPPCCNPEHLFLGTAQDNSDDMIRKGRSKAARGEQAGPSKLTEDQVRFIRSGAHGMSQAALARMFSVSETAIYKIVRNETWKHLLPVP